MGMIRKVGGQRAGSGRIKEHCLGESKGTQSLSTFNLPL